MATGRMVPGVFMSLNNKLQCGIWPWTEGIRNRLPRHFKKRYIEKFMVVPIPVHYIPETVKYHIDDFGQKFPVQSIPIPLSQVPESDMGLWGGEAFVFGYRKKKNLSLKPTVAHIWKPVLMKRNLYSEILDRWMSITVTKRTLNLIDENYGLDFYILKTHQVDLRSVLGMRLKREMLLSLSNKSMYPENPEKCEEIFEKYKAFSIPVEEAEWIGLSLTQAEKKQARIEEKEAKDDIVPYKQIYMKELIEQLKDGTLEDNAEITKKESGGYSSLKTLFGR